MSDNKLLSGFNFPFDGDCCRVEYYELIPSHEDRTHICVFLTQDGLTIDEPYMRPETFAQLTPELATQYCEQWTAWGEDTSQPLPPVVDRFGGWL